MNSNLGKILKKICGISSITSCGGYILIKSKWFQRTKSLKLPGALLPDPSDCITLPQIPSWNWSPPKNFGYITVLRKSCHSKVFFKEVISINPLLLMYWMLPVNSRITLGISQLLVVRLQFVDTLFVGRCAHTLIQC